MGYLSKRSFLMAGMTVYLALFPDPGYAQQHVPEPSLGVGYVVNAPHMFLGFSGQVVLPRWGGVGLYVDAKFDLESPAGEPGYEPDLTPEEAEQLGDEERLEEGSWRSFNAALLRPLSPGLTVYAGAGYARRDSYRKYFDSSRERGLLGLYWVADEEASGSEVNFLGGAFFRISRTLQLQFGVESAPLGMTVGGVFSIPLGR